MKQAKVYHKVHIIKGKEYHVESLTDTGRAEKEMTAIMALIKSTKHDPVKADAFRRECKIGQYREWEWDMMRLKEINNMVEKGEVTMHPRIKPKIGTAGRIAGGVNMVTGKKQLEREREQFIHQLNNE